MFLFTFITLLVTLVGIGIVVYNLINPSKAEPQEVTVANDSANGHNYQTLQTIKNDAQIDYNFTLDQTVIDQQEDDFTPKELRFEFPNLANYQANNLSRIRIPSLSINSPIIFGSNGDAALDQGFWFYPGSYNVKGEKIFFCHRRYWGRNHPHSCWYLDKLAVGQNIVLDTKSGTSLNYQVLSVTQVPAGDSNYLKASPDDYVKIITCAPLGYSTHRLIVIAKLVP